MGGLFLCVIRLLLIMQISELSAAYAEYLDRMYDQSDDLVTVDQYTIPRDVDVDNATMSEWCDVA